MNTIKQTLNKRGWTTVRTVARLWAAALVTALGLSALANCVPAGAGSTDDDTGPGGDGTGSRFELKENAADIASGSADSSPYGFFGFDGLVYFGADDGTNGEELWAYDGTSASSCGTSMKEVTVVTPTTLPPLGLVSTSAPTTEPPARSSSPTSLPNSSVGRNS